MLAIGFWAALRKASVSSAFGAAAAASADTAGAAAAFLAWDFVAFDPVALAFGGSAVCAKAGSTPSPNAASATSQHAATRLAPPALEVSSLPIGDHNIAHSVESSEPLISAAFGLMPG